MKNLEVVFYIPDKGAKLICEILYQHERLRNVTYCSINLYDKVYTVSSVATPQLTQSTLFINGYIHYDDYKMVSFTYHSRKEMFNAVSAFRRIISKINRRKLD